MKNNSVNCRISPALVAKIKKQQTAVRNFLGEEISFVKASSILARKIKL